MIRRGRPQQQLSSWVICKPVQFNFIYFLYFYYILYFFKFFIGKKTEKPSFEVNEGLNEKISLWRGDITTLEIDGIVNAGSVLIAVFVCFVLLFGYSGHSELLFAVPFHLHG